MKAFETIKVTVTTIIVLAMSDFSKLFVVEIDASDLDWGMFNVEG